MMLLASTLLAPVSASAAGGVIQIARVTADGARLRAATEGKPVITNLRRGERVFYLNKMIGSMCYVCTSRGQRGYVYKGYLTAYGAVQASQIYYSTTTTAAYNTSGKRIGTLGRHHFVIVYETRGNWAYVKTMSGRGGVVKLSDLASVF